jgi:membrane-associated phospholipid phosphatase
VIPVARRVDRRLFWWATVISAVSAILGLFLTGVVLGAHGPTPLDLRLQAAIAAIREPARTGAARLLTLLGGLPFLAAAAAALLAYCLRAERRRVALFSAVSLVGGFAVEQALKFAIHRPRPNPRGFLTSAVGYSFPSGHSMMSTVLYGLLAALALRSGRRGAVKGLAVAFLAFLILAVGASRVYLAVHWPTDVLFGYCAGLFWLSATGALAIATLGRRRGPAPPDRPAAGRRGGAGVTSRCR